MHATDRGELSGRGWGNKPLSEMTAVDLAEAIVLLENAGQETDPALWTALHEELTLRMAESGADGGHAGQNVEAVVEAVLDECR